MTLAEARLVLFGHLLTTPRGKQTNPPARVAEARRIHEQSKHAAHQARFQKAPSDV